MPFFPILKLLACSIRRVYIGKGDFCLEMAAGVQTKAKAVAMLGEYPPESLFGIFFVVAGALTVIVFVVVAVSGMGRMVANFIKLFHVTAVKLPLVIISAI